MSKVLDRIARIISSQSVQDSVRIHLLEVRTQQLEFMLEQAPMINMLDPKEPNTFQRLGKQIVPFAYVHPETFEPFRQCLGQVPGLPWYTFVGSRTKWILTDLMPKGRVIFTPNSIPGPVR